MLKNAKPLAAVRVSTTGRVSVTGSVKVAGVRLTATKAVNGKSLLKQLLTK